MLYSIMRRCLHFILCLSLLGIPGLQAAENDDAKLWQALRSGEGIALIRHALAPGTGDPIDFSLNDCSTQRNLSQQGRDQSAYIGQLFQSEKIEAPRLYSSQWCRCLETAELMALTEVNPQPLLNSFFANRADGPAQLAGLRQWLNEQPVAVDSPLILVTHQVVITGLTGVFPASGEIVVIRHPKATDTEIIVIGTLQTG